MKFIRPATDADVARMARIHQASFEKAWDAAELRRFMEGGGALVVEHRAAVAGFLLFRKVLDEAEILTFAVEKDQRGYGLGGKLMEAFIGQMQGEGVVRVFLEVAEDNPGARRLYARAEFIETGRRKGYYQRWHGKRVDAVLMERKIP